MRPLLNQSYLSGVTSLELKNFPLSTKVLYIGDKFRINDVTQEYTVVTSDVTSDGSGIATVTFTPATVAAYTSGIPVQVPNPRPLTDNMRAKVALESSTIIYFFRFDFDTIYRISLIEDAGGGYITLTSAAHGLSNGQQIYLDLPPEYLSGGNPTAYTISNATADTLRIQVAYDATAVKTGTFDVRTPVYLTTAPHDITWDSITWQGIGGVLLFDAIEESQDLRGSGVEMTMSGVDVTILAILLQKAYLGRFIKIWSGHVNDSAGTIECDSTKDMVFWGRINGGFEVEETLSDKTPGTTTIKGRMEGRLTSLDIVVGIQTNVNSHQRVSPGDKFFNQIPKLIGKQLEWGDIKTPKSTGCFFWTALAISLWNSNHLQTLRDYRDTKMEQSVKIHYKEVSPKIVNAIARFPCKNYIYRWIADFSLDLHHLVKQEKFIKAEKLYSKNLSLLEKFLGSA